MAVRPTNAERVQVADSDEALLVAMYPSLRRFAAVVGPAEVPPDDLVHDAIVAVLYLQHVEGQPLPEIAATLGISHAAARQLSSRARRALRDHLTNEETP